MKVPNNVNDIRKLRNWLLALDMYPERIDLAKDHPLRKVEQFNTKMAKIGKSAWNTFDGIPIFYL